MYISEYNSLIINYNKNNIGKKNIKVGIKNLLFGDIFTRSFEIKDDRSNKELTILLHDF